MRWTVAVIAGAALFTTAGCGVSVSTVHGASTAQDGSAGRGTATAAPGGSMSVGEPVSSPPTTVATISTAPPSPASPVVTVQAYVAAINAHDYQEAWNLGGKNVGQSYKVFVAGFADTEHDTLTVESVSGETVHIRLVSQQRDGSRHTYKGTYSVSGVIITGFHITKVG